MVDNKLITLTANEFLSIVAPEELFTKEDLDKTYKEFAKRWHPDSRKISVILIIV